RRRRGRRHRRQGGGGRRRLGRPRVRDVGTARPRTHRGLRRGDRSRLPAPRDQDVRGLTGDGSARVVSWQVKGWVGEEWRWHVDKPWDAPGWLPARVPGSIIDDLMRAGEVPDVYFETNSRPAESVTERAL